MTNLDQSDELLSLLDPKLFYGYNHAEFYNGLNFVNITEKLYL